MKFYHGTAKENLESIKTTGLVASVPKDVNFDIFPERGGSHAAVSLAKTIATAVCYGDCIIEVELPDATNVTKIEIFNEVLVSGDISASQITGIYEASPEAEWIPDEDVTDNHVIIGPVKCSKIDGRGFSHVVEIREIK